MIPLQLSRETYMKRHVLSLNDKITCRVRSLKMTRRIHPAGSSAHLTASSRRASTNWVVETSRPRGTYPDSANRTRLTASPAAEIHGSHTAVGGALGAVAVPSWFTERLQPQL